MQNFLGDSKSVEAELYLINQTGKVVNLVSEFSEIKQNILNIENIINFSKWEI